MQKLLRNYFFLALSIVLGFASCGSDEDLGGDGGGNTENQKMVGTKWTSTNWDYGIGDDWVSTLEETYNFYFYSSTEGLMYYGRKDNDSDFGSSSERSVAHFTYNVEGSDIELDYITEPLFSGFTHLQVDGDVLSANGIEFAKGMADANDNSWLATLHGTTGECKWYHSLSNGLWIVGEGDMADYGDFSQTPWAKADRLVNYVSVEKGVTSVGANAFANINVTEVDLPSTIRKIGSSAFSGSLITDISLSDDITEIPESAFSGCSYLTAYLPDNVETIGDFAFNGCKKVSLVSTKRLKHIGNHAFLDCNVTSWTDSEVLESIGMFAFSDCGFSELKLPNSLREIGQFAFVDAGISKIRIGTGLTTVHGTPFECSSRSGTMYVNQNTPLELTDDIVENSSKWTLYVPVGSKAAYSKAAYWKNFKSIRESSELAGDGTQPGEEDGGEDEPGGDDAPLTGTVQGHDYVDLGLSVKWATCNVGAEQPEQYGNYFCWGRTDSSQDLPAIASYVPDDISGTSYDAATKLWGSLWSTPTKAQVEELISNCTFETVADGLNRMVKVTSNINGQSILLPLAGYRRGFYERADTKFQTLNSGDAACFMVSEVYDRLSTSANVNYFMCKKQSSNATCSSHFELSTTIYSYTYQFTVRPVTE